MAPRLLAVGFLSLGRDPPERLEKISDGLANKTQMMVTVLVDSSPLAAAIGAKDGPNAMRERGTDQQGEAKQNLPIHGG